MLKVRFRSSPIAPRVPTASPSAGICKYYNRVVDKYGVRSRIVHKTLVEEARFSRSTGLWSVITRDLETKETTTRTANVFISAVGALSAPADVPFDTSEYDGVVVHSAKYDRSIDLKGKDVVVLGNGCSAAQIIPVRLRVRPLPSALD